MAQSCSVVGCQSKVSKGKDGGDYKFYRFPRDESLLEKWKDACKVRPGPRDRVCNLHFADSDYILTNLGWKVLVAGAVPTLCLPTSKILRTAKESETRIVRKVEDQIPSPCASSSRESNLSGASNSSYKQCLLARPSSESAYDDATLDVCGVTPTNKSPTHEEDEMHRVLSVFENKSLQPKAKPVFTKCSRRVENQYADIFTEETIFDCPICGKSFDNRLILLMHFNIHYHHSAFKCSKCGICGRICDRNQFDDHRKKCCRQKTYPIRPKIASNFHPFICKLCGLTFASRSDLRSHRSSIHVKPPRDCLVCMKGFTTVKVLKQHILNTHIGSHSFCDTCDRLFQSKVEFALHQQEHGSPNECPECCEQFAEVSDLASHLEGHKSVLFFACDFCTLIFASIEIIESHMAVHDSVDPVVTCHFCVGDTSATPRCNFHVHQFSDSLASEAETAHSITGLGTISNSGSRRESTSNTMMSVPVKVEIHEIDEDAHFLDIMEGVNTAIRQIRHGNERSAAQTVSTEKKRPHPDTDLEKNVRVDSQSFRKHSEGLLQSVEVKVEMPEIDDIVISERNSSSSAATCHGNSAPSMSKSITAASKGIPASISNTKLQCTDCDKILFSEDEMTLHQTLHESRGDFSCIECGKQCHSSKALTQHYEEHVKEECDEGWSSEDD